MLPISTRFVLTVRFACLLPAILCLIYLTGCSSASKINSTSTDRDVATRWLTHSTRMLDINRWRISGKIGLRTPEQANSAHLVWNQHDRTFDILLKGPLGHGGAQLTGNPERMRLTVAGQGEYTSDDPQQLLKQHTGWNLPVYTLLHWIRGIPAPGMTADYQLDSEGRLTSLRQSDWQLDYLSYHQLSFGWLPKKIKLHRHQTTLTLIIKQWDTFDYSS